MMMIIVIIIGMSLRHAFSRQFNLNKPQITSIKCYLHHIAINVYSVTDGVQHCTDGNTCGRAPCRKSINRALKICQTHRYDCAWAVRVKICHTVAVCFTCPSTSSFSLAVKHKALLRQIMSTLLVTTQAWLRQPPQIFLKLSAERANGRHLVQQMRVNQACTKK